MLELGGELTGFAAILPRADGNAELDAWFVEPSAWRRGLGRMLLDHCADAARTAGAAVLHVTGNPHAETFYLACRFERVGNIKTRFGIGYLFQRVL